MNLHPVVAGFIPNIFVTYRVKDGYAEIATLWGAMKGSVPISGASISLEGGGFLQVSVGTLTITGRNAETLVWNNVLGAKGVRARLKALAKPTLGAPSASTKAQETDTDQVPSGVKFSSKVVVVPGYLSGLTHSGEFLNLMERKSYPWINRGDIVGEFRIHDSDHIAPIRAPASGLLLHKELSCDGCSASSAREWNNRVQPPLAKLAILLPEDESAPESVQYIYSEMCRIVCEMKHRYLEKSRYWSMGPFTSEVFDELVKLQTAREPKIFDAVPNWRDYIEEAKVKRPELRSLLAHLRTP